MLIGISLSGASFGVVLGAVGRTVAPEADAAVCFGVLTSALGIARHGDLSFDQSKT
ncbi:MAG: hypothetical protein R3E60_07425 [Alphaproteobacteria bacterium]